MELPTAGTNFDLAKLAVAIGMVAQAEGLTINGDWPIQAYRNGRHLSLLPFLTPIGGIYMTSNAEESTADMMTERYGGTWRQIQNRMLIGAGDLYSPEDTGGNKDAIVPYHRHSIPALSGGATMGIVDPAGNANIPANLFVSPSQVLVQTRGWVGTNPVATNTSNTGYAGTSGDDTDANLPPYEAIYIYKKLS
jgi:hypothetical protein